MRLLYTTIYEKNIYFSWRYQDFDLILTRTQNFIASLHQLPILVRSALSYMGSIFHASDIITPYIPSQT